MRSHRLIRLFAFLLFPSLSFAVPLTGFHPSEPFHEQTFEQTLSGGVRSYTNASADYDPAKSTRLIIYLLPNGNNIAQTLGHELAPGDDWHFDIQHIAAQTRLLRHLDPFQNILLTLLEAPGRSWPKFRADHPTDNPQLIHALIQSAISIAPSTAHPLAVSLVAHSGGGSCIIGLLNSPDPLPAPIDRIAFLDANYFYSDDEHHGDKLLAWLRADQSHHLIVFAYDDRNVTFNGKKIVSDTGGTYRSTRRMIDFFNRAAPSPSETSDQIGPFEHHAFLNGQAQFFLHPNPELKILHTAMIGEMNIFLHALTADTPLEGKYGSLGGPRAYSQYVQPSTSTTKPAQPSIHLPARPANAPAGAAFLQQVQSLSTPDRERLVEDQILAGNFPDSLRILVPITVTAAGSDGQHTATYYVTPDVLAIGTDNDLFRMPLTPTTAQEIAGKLDCSMITRKISNDIYAHAAIKLDPRPLTEQRESPATFYQHNQIIQSQLTEAKQQTAGVLIAGHKKDVVLSPGLKDKPGKVAIYGWHKLDGKPIQPLYLGHVNWYVDYSHGIRLMSNHLLVDGKQMTVQQVLTSLTLCNLLSDEGIFPLTRYPASCPATTTAFKT